MGRYDSGAGKKSSRSALLLPILISVFVGIGGALFVYDNYRNKALNSQDFGKETGEHAVLDKYATDIKPVTEADLALKTPVTQETAPEITPETKPEPADVTRQAPLPDLLSSDQPVRDALISLSPGLATWLNTDQLIRRFFLIANDFSQLQRVTGHMGFLRLQEPFYVEQNGNELYIAEKNYERYKPFTEAVQMIDAKKAAALYKLYRPLLLQVYAELGYPKDITLESIINKAAGEIVGVPIIEEPVLLTRPSVYYHFADPKMEAANPVQKQMIRMGPENTRIIQNKCREFLVELGKLDFK